MRIIEIRIEGLFNMFDHTIPLNQEEHLTVIYGINGIGKTMIFRILDCFYNFISDKNFNDLSKLSYLPFQKVHITLDSGNIIILEKRDDVMTVSLDDGLLFAKAELSSHIPNEFYDKKNETNILLDKIKTFFINTNRLYFEKGTQQNNGTVLKITSKTINEQSKKLQQLITKTNNEYLKLSEQLGLSLSKRVLQNQIRRDLTYNELLIIKNEVESRITELQKIGLMRSDFEIDFELNDSLSKTDKTLIGANLMDFQLKLTVFDDLYEKLKLFLEILNKRRLRYKTIAVSEQNGFEITNIKNQKLKLDQLSTGEQHAIIMFYSLLFEVPENALVMIDEPENSLHIVWQKAYLDDIKDIIALRGFDVMIATHSPSIINGNWDLTVSLKGIEEVEYA